MTEAKRLSVLVVDDEFLARQRLEDLLRKEEGVEIVGMVESGRAAVEAIHRLAPDLVFLDIQMPGMTGIEVVETVGPAQMPVVVFATAYDQYALKAFEFAALDYLLKPFDDERFEQAFARARKAVAMRQIDDVRARLTSLLGAVAEPELPSAPPYIERIAVEMRGQVRVVPVAQVTCITASGTYAEIHTGGEKYLIRERMQTLEEKLDPAHFFRIHRSAIIRLDEVESLLYNEGGKYAVRLKDGKRLRVSRSRREALEARLGLYRQGG